MITDIVKFFVRRQKSEEMLLFCAFLEGVSSVRHRKDLITYDFLASCSNMTSSSCPRVFKREMTSPINYFGENVCQINKCKCIYLYIYLTCTVSSSPPLCWSESGTELNGTMPGRSRPPDLIILLIMDLSAGRSLLRSMGYHSDEHRKGMAHSCREHRVNTVVI